LSLVAVDITVVPTANRTRLTGLTGLFFLNYNILLILEILYH